MFLRSNKFEYVDEGLHNDYIKSLNIVWLNKDEGIYYDYIKSLNNDLNELIERNCVNIKRWFMILIIHIYKV